MKPVIAALLIALVGAAFAANLFLGDLAEDEAMRVKRLFDERVAGYQAGADAGNATAQLELAKIYMYADEGLADPELAVALLRKAVAQGNADAHYELGLAYERGRGVDNDNAAAAKLYSTAIRMNGHRRATLALGMMYFEGRGVVHSEARAAALFEQAATLGEPAAQFLMGRIHESGFGVREDAVEAYKWYALAARDVAGVRAFNRRFDPVKAQDELSRSMNQSQIDTGRRLAENWKAK